MGTKPVSQMTPDELAAMRKYKREWARASYAKDPERARANAKTYAQRHPDRVKSKQAKWDAANRDRKSFLWARWIADPENRQSADDRAAKWREANRDEINEKSRQWFKTHPVENRRYQHIRRARAAANTTGHAYTTAEWKALVLAYDGRCGYCGASGFMSVDHRVPLIRGGSNSIENILPACLPCNKRKSRKTDVEFRALLEHHQPSAFRSAVQMTSAIVTPCSGVESQKA